MRFAALALAAALAAVLGGCHPLAMFVPSPLPKDAPLAVTSLSPWPKAEVQVFTDDLGIPHIYGKSQPDVAYALGYMHGRDRAFQIFLYVHAAEGRLTEILGEDLLDVDRDNRLLMTGVDEQLAAFSPRDEEMAEAYCAGLNQGALAAGRSAEMTLLGVDWETLTPRDVLAVVRLQQWDQSMGMAEEAARFRLVKALGRDHPVVRALLVDAPSGGVPVVAAAEDEAVPASGGAPPATPGATPAPEAPHADAAPSHEPATTALAELTEEVRAMFSRGGTGASNSWSVSPKLTAKGVAVLSNDPHLDHTTPGIFYMADLHTPGFVVAGGTFPGIPAVLIGHGRHIAWGVTNAYADTQDLVVLQPDGDGYLVDGKHVAFTTHKERFKLGRGKDAKVIEQTWKTSMFGPVLPEGYGGWVKGDALALLWTAARFPKDNGRLVSGFWDLAAANNVDEATKAVQDFASPAMSVNMAFTDGTIAYRLSGIVPVRQDAERVDFPRDGSKSTAGWTGRLSADEKPHETNPKKGYIVASNQRVLENGVGAQAAVGFEGARPYRAMRIDARIHALIDEGKKAKTDDLLAIQQDITAIDAQQLAPIYAHHCPKHVGGFDDDHVAAFCDAIRKFDGVFTEDAIALPFVRTNEEMAKAVLRAHVDASLVDALMSTTFAPTALTDAAVNEEIGAGLSPLFDDPKTPEREGLDGFVARAVTAAMTEVFEESGGTPDDWRWGKLHTLGPRGVLARVPVVGGLFVGDAHAESGYGTTPRAEHPDYKHHLRVVAGAGLRLIAEMTDPPTVRMINDSGESGHFGSPHLDDQYPLWHAGKPRVLSLDVATAEKNREGALVLKPAVRPLTRDALQAHAATH